MACHMNSFDAAATAIRHACGGCCSARRARGFAYLWTLLLIALMGVGLVIASEIYSTAVQRDRERQLIFIGREFRNAIARYYESNAGGAQHQYPATLDDLLKDPRFPHAQRHLRRLYIDPMTGKAEWGTVLIKGRIAGIHSLSEKMPIKQDHFEVSEAGFRGKEKYAEWVFTYPSDLLLSQPKNNISPDNRADGILPGQLMIDARGKEASGTSRDAR